MPLKKVSAVIVALIIASHVVSDVGIRIVAPVISWQSLHQEYTDKIISAALFIMMAMAIVLIIFRNDISIGINIDDFGSRQALWSYLFGMGLAIAIFVGNWLANTSQLTFFTLNFISYNADKSWRLIIYLILIALAVPVMMELIIHHIWMKVMLPYFGPVMTIIMLGLIYTYMWNVFGYYSTLSISIATGIISYRTKSATIVIFTNSVTVLSKLARIEVYRL